MFGEIWGSLESAKPRAGTPVGLRSSLRTLRNYDQRMGQSGHRVLRSLQLSDLSGLSGPEEWISLSSTSRFVRTPKLRVGLLSGFVCTAEGSAPQRYDVILANPPVFMGSNLE